MDKSKDRLELLHHSSDDTPVSRQSDTPVSRHSVTPVSRQSDTPVSRHSVTPVSRQSDTPVSKHSATPVSRQSDTPVSRHSVTPVSEQSVTPSPSRSIVRRHRPIKKRTPFQKWLKTRPSLMTIIVVCNVILLMFGGFIYALIVFAPRFTGINSTKGTAYQGGSETEGGGGGGEDESGSQSTTWIPETTTEGPICTSSNNTCQNGGTCMPPFCVCMDGYTGIICETDLDKCLHKCNETTSVCQENAGRYACECLEGFENLYDTCKDIDECLVETSCDSVSSTCENTIASYTCECKNGFQKIAHNVCEDINECAKGYCVHTGQNTCCMNLPGSYRCGCCPNYYPRRLDGMCEIAWCGEGASPISRQSGGRNYPQGRLHSHLTTRAHDGAYPWMVQLRLDGHLKCGATLLKNQWVITAATCVTWENGTLIDTSRLSVRVGTNHRTASIDTLQTAQVAELKLEPRYVRDENVNPNREHNLAMVRVAGDVGVFYSDAVRHVCLSQPNTALPGGCYIAGWGGVAELNPPWQTIEKISDELWQIKVFEQPPPDYFTHGAIWQHCNENAKFYGIKERVVNDTQYCIRTRDLSRSPEMYPRDGICSSDVGGPLVCPANATHPAMLYGVMSESLVNCDWGNVVIKVNVYLNWINSVLAG